MIIRCCVCHKIKINKHWEKVPANKETVSHSYCPSCRINTLISMAQERKDAVAVK